MFYLKGNSREFKCFKNKIINLNCAFCKVKGCIEFYCNFHQNVAGRGATIPSVHLYLHISRIMLLLSC